MRDQRQLLFNLSEKDSNLKDIINGLDSLSPEDILKLNRPVWIKKTLTKMLDESLEMRRYKNIEAFVLANCHDVYNEDFEGDIIQWTGCDIFLKFGRTEVLVRMDDILFVTVKGIWLDTIFTNNPDARLTAYKFLKKSKFTEYKIEIKKMIEKRHFGTFKEDYEPKSLYTVKKWTGEFPT